MLVLLLAAVAIAYLFYYCVVKSFSYWTERGVQQGNAKWIFEHTFKIVFRTQSFAETIVEVYNKCSNVRYFGTYQLFERMLMLKDPELIKQITVKDFDHFTDHRTLTLQDEDPIWTKNLVGLTGQKWRDMRAILSPSFTSSKMRAMFTLMVESGENFIQHFLKKDQDVLTFEMKDVFTRFTNDVIATTAFGIKVDSLCEPNNQFYLMGKEATDFTGVWKNLKFFGFALFPKLFSFFKIKLFNQEVSAFFKDIVDNAIKTREEKGIVRPDMIQILMEARKGGQTKEEKSVIDTGFATAQEQESDTIKSKQPCVLTDVDITAQAFIFFFAGFDTVSSLMCFVSYELAVNQDVQDRLRHEVQETLEECKGKLTYEALLKMKYMDMVVSETLRKWPNAIITDRVCTKSYTINPTTPDEKPVHLEPGDQVCLPIFGIHRDPKFYPDPERFDPERFNDENKGNIKPYTYFPFGLGPRNCIGSRFALLETKTVFFYILSNFELVPVEKTKIPLQISRTQLNLTADGGFWLGVKRVKNSFLNCATLH